MSLLRRKLVRELRRQGAQTAVLLLVQALGVGLYVGSYGGYLDLRESYAAARETMRLADVHADVATTGDAAVARVAAVDGVAEAMGRAKVSLPVTLADGRLGGTSERGEVTLEGRFLSLPDEGDPALDRLALVSGRMPAEEDEVLLERHLADWHGLSEGSTVAVAGKTLKVSGVASSAEYLWVARSAQDPLPMPDAFGVLWMRRSGLADVAGGVKAAELRDAEVLRRVAAHAAEVAAADGAPSAGEAAVSVGAGPGGDAAAAVLAAMQTRSNELLYDLEPGADPATVAKAVDAALGEPARASTLAKDLVGPRLLQMDIDGMRTMALAFPVFFLGVAAFVSIAGLARAVDAQRAVIGTFLALGMPRRRVLAHYAGFAVATGAFASVVGGLLGLGLARGIATEYAAELQIPFVVTHVRPDVLAIGLAAGILSSLVAGLLPALRAARLAPAEAMRPPAPAAGPLVRASRRLARLPLALRLPVRNLLRHPLRAAATAVGVAAALVLVVATAAVSVSTQRVADVQLVDAQRFDLRVDLAAPLPDATLRQGLADTREISASELSLTLPVAVEANGRRRAIVVSAVASDAALLRPVDWDGAPIRAHGGVLLARADADALGVSAGDAVTLRGPDDAAHAVRVDGIVATALGPVATMDLADARSIFGLGAVSNTVVVTTSASRTTREALLRLPGAVGLSDVGGLRAQLGMLMGLNLAMVGMMLGFAGVLGAAVLYTTATLGILERARELATLRALGAPMRSLAVQSTVEHGLLGVAGLGIGLLVGHPLARRLVAAFDSDLFTMPFVWSWGVVAATGAGVVVVLLLAQVPALRAVARLDLAANVRGREG